MKYIELEDQLRQQLAAISKTDPQDWYIVYRARYGMQVALEAIAAELGDGRVITQSFTCATAVNPILVAGQEPHYADINEATLSIDMGKLVCPRGSRAMIVMHCFGLQADMAGARRICDDKGMVLMEDSAHRLGYISRDKRDVPLADISIHSFGAEKMLRTKFGGAIWVNPAMKNGKLAAAIRQRLAELPELNWGLSQVSSMYTITNASLNRLPGDRLSKLIRTALSSAGLMTPPIAPIELQAKQATTPAKPAAWMVRQILDEMEHFDDIVRTRIKAVELYNERGTDALIPTAARLNRPYVRFPLVLPTPQAAQDMLQLLRDKGFHPGTWYRPTLFPGVKANSAYKYDPESCPTAEEISARIINLPTNVPAAEAKEMRDVVFG